MFCGLTNDLSWRMLRVCLRRMCILLLLDGMFLYVTVECESENHSVVSNPLWLMDYTVHGIQARILEWVDVPFPRGFSQPRDSLNPGLPHWRWILYQLSHQESPRILEWVAYPFSSGSSWPRYWTEVSCIAGIFFTSWATRKAHMTVRPIFKKVFRSIVPHWFSVWMICLLIKIRYWNTLIS